MLKIARLHIHVKIELWIESIIIENLFQCHSCRNINYKHLDAFLCNEYGASKYVKYKFAICARPDFAVEKIKMIR